jgi:hypothetical protein
VSASTFQLCNLKLPWKMVATQRRAQNATHQSLTARYRLLLVINTIRLQSFEKCAKHMFTSRGKAFYWTKRFFCPEWHSKKHGGTSLKTFTIEEEKQAFKVILDYLRNNQDASLTDIIEQLRQSFSRFVSRSVTQRLLKKLGWTWRIPVAFQVHKYRRANIARYLDHLQGIREVDPTRVKFLDEAHVVSKDLHKRRVLGLRSCRTWVKRRTLNEASGSITILTSLDPTEPVAWTYRESTNDQWAFLSFVLWLCQRGYLQPGDYLVLDNAAIHGGSSSLLGLRAVLRTWEVRLIFLPAYSPELNPCELVSMHSTLPAHSSSPSLSHLALLPPLPSPSPPSLPSNLLSCLEISLLVGILSHQKAHPQPPS